MVDSEDDDNEPSAQQHAVHRSTTKRGKSSISGITNSADINKKEPAVSSSATGGEARPKRSSRSAGPAAAAVARMRAAEALAKIKAAVAPCGGICYWCYAVCVAADETIDVHDPNECTMREKPDLSDFDEKKRRMKTLLKALGADGAPGQGQAWRKSTLNPEQQKALRTAKESARTLRTRALVKAAQQRACEHLAALDAPIVGRGPCGAFSFYQEIVIDFAMRLQVYLTEEQLARAPASVNAAALQKFTKLVKAAGLASLHAARTKDEAAITNFVALRHQLWHGENAKAVHQLIIAVREKERIKYTADPAIKDQITSSSTVLDIIGAVRKALQPKRGRPPNTPTMSACSDSGMEIAQNWAEGGYTVDSMEKRAQFDTRRINISQKETQADVLSGVALVFSGAPSLTEMRAFKPRNRPLQISHAGTARLHAIQLNRHHTKEAARRVEGWFPQWDEGSKRGVTAVMAGANGLLNGVEGESLVSSNDFYSDALGLEILSNKTGKGVAEKVIAILERRGIKEFYIVGTDAVTSNIGHVTGAIAYLRRHFKQPLIFALRCNGHIDMRAYKKVLETMGSEATRSPIKRKADEATIPAELLAIEDLYYIEKKWPDLAEAMQARLPNGETLLKTSGCPDSRWTFWEELLRNKVGCTKIMGRLMALWRKAVLKYYAETGLDIDASEVPAEEPLLGDRVPLRVVMVIIAEDEFNRQLFDFTLITVIDAEDHILFSHMCDAYTGPWILDHLDVAMQMLGGDGVREALQGELHEDGVTWDPPAECPVSSLTAQSLPGLLLDVSSQYMRIRQCILETIGHTYVMAFLHRKEMRYPGIAFEAHEIIGTQREIGMLFGVEGAPWTIRAVESKSERFAVMLDAAIRYAQSVDLEEYTVDYVDQCMAEHSEYFNDQTDEWWSNPVFRLAGLGSAIEDSTSEYHATFHARWLVEQTVPELRAAIAELLHVQAADVKEAMESAGYDGPLTILADDELWHQLVAFSKQTSTLSKCEGVGELRAVIHKWYKPLYLTNVWMEELVKEFKNLSPQARAHPATAEVRILLRQRARPDLMGSATRQQIKAIRRELGHHLPSRLRPKRPPPVALDPIVWEGDPPQEDGEKEQEDIEGLSVATLKERLKERGERNVPRSHAKLVELLQQSLDREEPEAEDEPEEEDQEDEGEPDGDEPTRDEQAVLEQLRADAPSADRTQLVEGRAFFCWDNAKQEGYFPLVCKEDVRRRAQKIKVMCLMPLEGRDGVYVVDPEYDGETGDAWKDTALCKLIFDARPVTGEVWREVEGGCDGQRAWRVVKVSRE